MASYLSSLLWALSFSELANDFNVKKALFCIGLLHFRRERCLKETEGFFAPAVTSLFIRSKGVANSEKAVEQVDMMVDVMKSAFKENLDRWVRSVQSINGAL